MSPTIRIDDDVYEFLKGKAEAFVDTPNSVLRRVLGLGAETASPLDPDWATEGRNNPVVAKRPVVMESSGSGKPGAKPPKATRRASTGRARAPRGALLPEERYEVPLLEALVEVGGSGSSKEVIQAVGRKLADELTSMDRSPLRGGGPRWENRVQFVRLRLIHRGLMERDTSRGVWAISSRGREWLAGRDGASD